MTYRHFSTGEETTPYRYAEEMTDLRANSFGLSHAFNANTTEHGGPIDYALFTRDNGNEKVFSFTSVFHGPNDLTAGGADALSQSLELKFDDKTGQITMAHASLANASASHFLREVFGQTYYHYQSSGSLIGWWDKATLKMAESPVFRVADNTESPYLQHVAEKYPHRSMTHPGIAGTQLVQLPVSNGDPTTDWRVVTGELVRDFFQGYAKQDPREAAEALHSLPPRMMEALGLEVVEQRIVGNSLLDERTLGADADDLPYASPAFTQDSHRSPGVHLKR